MKETTSFTKQDLLNIGLSKNYVKSILARIKESYKAENDQPIQEHEMTWGKEYEE